MKGIREAAMGSPDPEPKAYNPSQRSLLDDYDDYGAWPYNSKEAYKPPAKPYSKALNDQTIAKFKKENIKRIQINLIVTVDELGNIGDENSEEYNWNKAQLKAEQIAYDRIDTMLKENWLTKYSLENFETYDDGDEYEITATLIPNK